MWKTEYAPDASVSCGNGVLRIATDAPGVDAFTLRIGKDFMLSTLPVRIGELSESMALPPPTARMKSTPSFLQSSMP